MEEGKGSSERAESERQRQPQGRGGGGGSRSGKSCKGCLYYSSALSAKRDPRCVGITRSLPQVPRYVNHQVIEASKDGRSLREFKYACVGYSVYVNKNGKSPDPQKAPAELPVCVGVEVFLVEKARDRAGNAPSRTHHKEGCPNHPQEKTHKPANLFGDEFLTRFTRNANVVASGMAKNMRKVGNYIKENVDDILNPYRRGPK